MANTLLNPVASTTSAPATQSSSSQVSPSGTDTKDMFLKLMVAQIQNQDPLSPVDGTAFLQQLSQISGVEQMVEMRQQLEAIRQDLDPKPSAPDPTPATGPQ